MSTLTYPYVLLTKELRVESRHKTAEAAFKAANKFRARFSPHAVMEVRDSSGAVNKSSVVSEKWIREKARRIGFDPVDKTTYYLEMGWY